MTADKTKMFSMECETFHNLFGFLSPSIWFLSHYGAPADAASSPLNKPGFLLSMLLASCSLLPSWSTPWSLLFEDSENSSSPLLQQQAVPRLASTHLDFCRASSTATPETAFPTTLPTSLRAHWPPCSSFKPPFPFARSRIFSAVCLHGAFPTPLDSAQMSPPKRCYL